MKALRLRWSAILLLVVLAWPVSLPLSAQQPAAGLPRAGDLERRIEAVMPKVITWRRDIHQHPELSNREFRTAELVARHLTALGLEVRTGVAHTGVIGILNGGRPGPTVALRADMDGLPVTELVDLPFKSTERTEYNGQDVGVMHACGHDNHVAILMGVAEVLAGMREEVPGTVKFIFQPAEEGAPVGEEGGAGLMIREGVLENPTPDAIFGLHVWPERVGTIGYRSGPLMAASDRLSIVVKGKQTHGALPWGGVDPIVVASQIILGLQTIASRQIEVTKVPAIITIGMIQGGNRGNIIPDSVVMEGTVRSFDEGMRADIKDRIRRTAVSIAQSAGATAMVEFGRDGNPVTFNDPALTERMLPTLRRVVGDKLQISPLSTPAEDFALYQQRVPGFFFFLGITPDDVDLETVARNHSPLFFADEAALPVGVRALVGLTLDYFAGQP
jgi:amidohydrolase